MQRPAAIARPAPLSTRTRCSCCQRLQGCCPSRSSSLSTQVPTQHAWLSLMTHLLPLGPSCPAVKSACALFAADCQETRRRPGALHQTSKAALRIQTQPPHAACSQTGTHVCGHQLGGRPGACRVLCPDQRSSVLACSHTAALAEARSNAPVQPDTLRPMPGVLCHSWSSLPALRSICTASSPGAH